MHSSLDHTNRSVQPPVTWLLGFVVAAVLFASVLNSGAQTLVGSPLMDRGFNDGAAGQVYLYSVPSGAVGVATSFQFYDNEAGSRRITPLIFEKLNATQYVLRGVGASITTNGAGAQTYPFSLIAGTNVMSANYTFGFTDREVSYGGSGTAITTTASYTGTVDWDYTAPTEWLFTPSLTFELSLGQAFDLGGLLFNAETRTYSAQIVISPATPTVTSISPTSGSTTGGTSVTINGTNFTGATGVTIGGSAATSVSVVNATTITCTTPAGSAGTVSVVVTTPGGSNAANALFTYIPPPDYIVTTTGNAIVVTDSTGNGDTLSISEPSAGNIQFAAAGRNFSVDGGANIAGNSGALSLTGMTSITVNAGAGADTINIGTFTGTLPSLTLNGGIGNDAVNFNGDITFAASANLNADLFDDDASPGTDGITVAAGANLIVSGAGAVTLKGNGAVSMAAGASVESVNGAISLTSLASGLSLTGATVTTSGTGNVTLAGTGVGEGGGISISGGSVVSSTGTGLAANQGLLTLTGTGSGSGTGFTLGGASSVTSVDGAISITGTGTAGGVNRTSKGIIVDASTVHSTGTATITLTGKGNSYDFGSDFNAQHHGIQVSGATTLITSAAGKITLDGDARYGRSANNFGVVVQNGAGVTGTGTAEVELIGITRIGSGIGYNGNGIVITGTGSRVTTVNGPLKLTGTGANQASSIGVLITTDGQVASTAGNITITGSYVGGGNATGSGILYDSATAVSTSGTISLVSGTGIGARMILSNGTISGTAGVTVRAGAGVPIDLGSTTDTDSRADLSDAELDLITTSGTFAIGDANSGAITVSAAITRSASTTMALASAGSIIFNPGTIATGGGALSLTSGASGSVQPITSGTDVMTSVSSAVAFGAGSKLAIAIAGAVEDTDYSPLSIAGQVNLTGVTLVPSGAYVPAASDSFVLIKNDGSDAINGTFSGLAEGAVLPNFLGSGVGFKITYLGGTGNDVVLSIANRAPIAVADAFATPTDIARTISAADLVANDTDQDGNTLTVTSVQSPTNGASVSLNAGMITYTPAAAFTGTATFAYSISDGAGGTANGTVTMTVNASAPVVLNDSTLEITTPTTITNPVTFSGDGGLATTQPVTLQGPVTVMGTPTISTTNTVTINGAIDGDGQLEKTGSGTLNLTAASTFTGGFKASEGEVGIGNDAALGTGTVTLGGATVNAMTETRVLENPVDLMGNTTVKGEGLGLAGPVTVDGVRTLTTEGNVDVDGTIQGGAITKLGGGDLVLAGNNTFSGGVTTKEGTLGIASDGALGTGQLNLAGGNLEAIDEPRTVSNPVAVSASTKVSGEAVALNGPTTISGSPVITTESDVTLGGKVDSGSAAVEATLIKEGPAELTLAPESQVNVPIEVLDGVVNDLGVATAEIVVTNSEAPSPPSDDGLFGSQAIVQGRSAMSYFDVTNGDLKYQIASNAEATLFERAVVVDSTGEVGQFTSLFVVNGNPAISYYDKTNGNLKYVRANDAMGTIWGTPVTVATSGDVGQYTSLVVVGGQPAIAYYDQTARDLMYVRASDANGAAWGTPVRVQSKNDAGKFASMQVVAGNPAIAYFDETRDDLLFIRASDANGTTWPVIPQKVASQGNIGRYASLCVVNGNPAISCYDETVNKKNKNGTARHLCYTRAGDATGTAWPKPKVVDDSSANIGSQTALQVVNGHPAISYLDATNKSVKYAWAADASGANWPVANAVVVHKIGSGPNSNTSLQVVNGLPGVIFYDPLTEDIEFKGFAEVPVKAKSASAKQRILDRGGRKTSAKKAPKAGKKGGKTVKKKPVKKGKNSKGKKSKKAPKPGVKPGKTKFSSKVGGSKLPGAKNQREALVRNLGKKNMSKSPKSKNRLGSSPGLIEEAEDITWEAGVNIEWDINDALGMPGLNWDSSKIGGSLDIIAGSDDPIFLELVSLQPDNTPGTLVNFNPYVTQTWKLASTGEGISGFAADNFFISTDEFTNDLQGGTFALVQSGNDLNIVFTPGTTSAPEITVEVAAVPLTTGGAAVNLGGIGAGTSTTRTFTIRNDGVAALTGITIGQGSILVGDDLVGLDFDVPDVNTLAPGASLTFDATLVNNQAGADPAAASFVIESNDGDEGIFTVTLTANSAVIPEPEIAIVNDADAMNVVDGSPTAVDFGTVSTGAVTTLSLTITNSGTADLNGVDYIIDGAHSIDFRVLAPPADTIAPGQTAAMVIEFEPSASGVRTAALHVSSNDGDESPFDILLTGIGDAVPEIAVSAGNIELTDASATPVDFGIVSVNSSQDVTFTISNVGALDLTGLTVNKDGADADQFSISSPLTVNSLVGSSTTTFTVRFAPTSGGVKTAALHIPSNDANENPFDILITGEGVVAPEIAVEYAGANLTSGDTVDAGAIAVGNMADLVFTTKNVGSANLTGLAVSIGGANAADFSVFAAPAASLAGPAGSTTFTVRFVPSLSGPKTATLQIANNDSDESPFLIRLSSITDYEIQSGTSGSTLAGNLGLNKTGGGAAILTGDNTFTGSTNILGGTLTLNGTLGGNSALPTDGSSGNTDITIDGGSLLIGSDEQIGNNAGIVLTTGSFGFSGSGLTETIGTFTNNGGTFSTGANTLIGTGNTITWAAGTNTINAGGTLVDTHYAVTGGTNTVEGGATRGTLHVQGGGLGLEFDGTSSPTITLNSDAVQAGRILLEGNVNVLAGLTSGTAQILNGGAAANAGFIDMNGGTRTFTVANGSAATDLLISALVTNGALTKDGAGTLELSGANTYTGATTVSAGTLSITGSINSSATLAINGGELTTSGADKLADTAAVTVGGGTLTLGGNDTVGTLALNSGIIGGSATLTATTYGLAGGTVNGNLGTGTINSSGTVALNGTAGATTVNVTAGALTLGGSSAMNSATTVGISGGTLTLGANDQVGNGATVTVSGGTLDLGNRTDTVATFELSSGFLNGSGTLTAANYNLSGGTVQGNLGAGTINSSGTVALNGSTAATTVNVTAGTLTYGSSDRLNNGATVTVSGGALALGAFTDTVSIFNMSAGSLNGTGTLTATTYGLSGGTVTANLGTGTINSSGTVALNGTAGATTVNVTAGTLTLGSSDRLADGATVTVSGGTLTQAGPSTDTVATFNMSAGSFDGSGTLTATTYGLSGGTVFGNLGTGTINSSGTVTLNGSTAATTVNITGGSLNLGSDDRLNNGATVTVSGGALGMGTRTDTVSIFNMSSGTITGTGTLTATTYGLSGGTVTANLGTGTINSSGTVALNGTAGATTVNVTAGTLTLGSSDRLADGATVTVSGGTLTQAGPSTDTVATFNMSAGSFDGSGTLTATTYGLSGGTVFGNLGTGTINSSGTVALNGSTAATTVNISAGTLTLGSANRLANTAAVNLTGGTLAIGAFDDTVGAVTLTSGSITGSTGVLTGTSYAVEDGSISAILGGTGALTKTTGGTVILSGANTYTGTTTVSAGTLQAGSAVAFTNKGALSMSGTGIFNLGGFDAAFTNLTASTTGNTLTNNGSSNATLNFSNLNTQISSLIQDGTRTLGVSLRNDNSGTNLFKLDSANTFSGGVTLLDGSAVGFGFGSRLRISNLVTTVGPAGAIVSSPFGTGAITIGQVATDKAGILFDTTANNTIANAIVFNTALGTDFPGIRVDTAATGLVLSGQITANLANAMFSTNGGATVNLTGQVTGALGLQTNASAIAVTLNNAADNNDYAGNTITGSSSFLNLGRANQIPNGAGKGNVANAGTLNLNGFSETINGLSGAGTIDGVSGTPTLTIGDNDASSTYSGVIRNTAGTLSLTKTGAGTMTLDGTAANTYTGATTINGGVLVLNKTGAGSENAIAAGGSVVINSGGTLRLGTQGQINDSITSFSINGGTFDMQTFTEGVNPQISLTNGSIIGGNTNFLLARGGYAGSGTNSISKRISVRDADANSGLFDITGGTTTVSGVIHTDSGGAAGISKTGAGTLVLSGANTYAGTTTVSAGTLSITESINSSATIAVNGGLLSTSGADKLLNTAAVTVGGGTLTIGGNDTVGSLVLTSGTIGGTATLTAATYGLQGGFVNGSLGAGILTKSTGGTVTLSGTAAATTVDITGGTLTLGTNERLDNGATVTVSGTGILNVDAFAETVNAFNMSAGSLDGTGTLTAGTYGLSGGTVTANLGTGTINSSGTVAFNGTAGATTVNITGGTLTLGSADRLADGASVSITGGGTLAIGTFDDTVGAVSLTSGSITGSGGVLTSASTYSVASGSVSAILGGSVGLTKTAPGTVTLSGANTYTGATTISQGTLALSGSGALADSSAVSVNGATGIFDISGISGAGETVGSLAGVVSSSVVLGTKNLTAGGDDTSTIFAGAISGAGGSLTKAGAGTLTLNSANSYTGLTTVSAGILNIQNATALGTTAGGTSVSNGATLQLQGGITVGAETLSLNGGAAAGQNGALVNVSGTNSFGGAITVAASSSISAAGGSVLNLTGGLNKDGTVLTFNGGGTINVSTVGITGASANSDLVVDGVTVNLNVANTYVGPTFIRNSGTLNATVLGALPTGTRSALTFDGTGTSVLTMGADQVVASLTSAGAATVTLGANTLTVGTAAGSTTFAGSIGGTGGLTKDGASTQVLSGSNSYTGATTISAGTLALSGSGELSDSSAVNLSGASGVFDISAISAVGETIASLAGVGGSSVVLGSKTLTSGGNNSSTTFAGVISGTGGSLIKNGSGALTLSGANTYTGATTINTGGTLNINHATAIGTGALIVGGTVIIDNTSGAAIVLSNNNALNLSGGSLTFTGTNNLSFGTGALTINGANRTVTTTAGVLTIGSIDAAGTSPTTRSFTKLGAGTLVITGAAGANFQGGFVNDDGTVIIGDKGALGTGRLTMDGGTLQASTDLSGANALIVSDWVLAASSTFSGSNSITIGNSTAGMDASRSITNDLAATKTLSFGSFNISTDAINRTLTVTGSGDTAFTGTISNGSSAASNLLKSGTGKLTLSAANTYAGGTTISAGTLELTGAGSLADSTAVNLTGATGVFDISAITASSETIGSLAGVASSSVVLGGKNLTAGGDGSTTTFSGVLSGSGGSLTKTGAGTLTLGGANTYTGATTVSAGTLALTGAGRISDSSSVVVSGGTFAIGSVSDTVASVQLASGSITGSTGVLTSSSTYDVQSGSVSAILGGTVGLTKTTVGTVTLSGVNTYAGATQLSAGDLVVDGSIGSSSLTTIDGGTLRGTGTVGAIQLNSGGAINPAGISSAGTLNTGNIAIVDGQLRFNLGGTGSYDQLNTTGTINLAAGGTGARLVIDAISGYVATLNDAFTLVSNDLIDAITGQFAKVNTSGTNVVTISGVDYVQNVLGSNFYGRINYAGSSADPSTLATAGNDIVLKIVTPEITVTEGATTLSDNGGYNFGDVDKVVPAVPLTKTFTIKNDGEVDLMNIAITPITGAAMADYILNTTGTATNLIPGASTTFTVTFDPQRIGARNAYFSITSNDLNEATFDIPLTGVGAIARDIQYVWKHSYGGPDAPGTPRSGVARAVAVQKSATKDEALAVFATGFTTNAAGNKDVYTTKHDPVTGAVIWEKFFDGTSGGNDECVAIELDSMGDVFVTGYTSNAAGNFDVLTAKYSGIDGQLLWHKIYAGVGDSYDSGNSVAVDTSGNVAVAGYGVNAAGGMDWFVARYSSDGLTTYFEQLVEGGNNRTDVASAVAVDATGNLLVAGYKRNALNNKDFMVRKLSSANGAEEWQWVVNGPSNTDDEAFGVAVDGSGAVFATGTVRGINYDFYTVKLNSAGAMQWANQWDSSFSSSDAGYKVVVDSQGDVVVAGVSYAPLSDGYVVKYSGTSGAQRWSRRFNGAANQWDYLTSIDLDLLDNVVAVGTSQNANGSYDVLTAKMLAADGGLLWEQRFDGSGTGLLSDLGYAVAVSPDGNVFVAGSATVETGAGEHNPTDFLVMNYNAIIPVVQAAQTITFANPGAQSSGTPLNLVASASSGLTVHFTVVSGPAQMDAVNPTQLNFTGNGPVTVRASQSGSSVYAAATSVNRTFTVNRSAQTIAFTLPATLSSTAQWPLTGVASSGLAVSYSIFDDPGNIANISGGILSFTGTGPVTVRASQAGDARYNAAADVDAVVTVVNNAPIIILDNIAENWRDLYPGSGAGEGNDIALQLSGNDAVAGFVAGYTITGTGKDLYLAKYDSAGTKLWTRISGTSGDDEAMAVVVDGNGDVVVAGYITGANGQDVFVAKYNGGTGMPMWANSYSYNGAGNGNDVGVSLALEGLTNVVVGGYAVGAGTGNDFFAAKLDLTTGAEVWASTQNRTTTTSDVPARVVVGTDGSVVLAGITNSDAWTVKLAAADGTKIWEQRYNFANKPDAVRGLALDGANNVIIAAYSQGNNYDMYTAKYAALDGTLIWGQRYNSSFNSSDAPWDMALDEDANVYVTGTSYRAPSVRDGMTLKYSGLNGTLLWEGRYNGTSSANDENFTIALDGIGNPVISGYTTNADGTTDVYLAKHNKGPGDIRWQRTFDGANNKNDNVKKVRVDPNGNVWMAGSATSNGGQKEVLVLRHIPAF